MSDNYATMYADSVIVDDEVIEVIPLGAAIKRLSELEHLITEMEYRRRSRIREQITNSERRYDRDAFVYELGLRESEIELAEIYDEIRRMAKSLNKDALLVHMDDLEYPEDDDDSHYIPYAQEPEKKKIEYDENSFLEVVDGGEQDK